MIDRLFLAHPRRMRETYFVHAATAARFGLVMIAGGLAALVHALVPALFARAASDRVKILYGEMKARQPAFAGRLPAFAEPEWRIEYEI
jgi:hypothetical protein